MERLTKKAVGCFRYDLKDHKHINGEFGDYDAFFDYNMAVKRLGEYEDTGLEPSEVKAKCAWADKMCKTLSDIFGDSGVFDFSHFKELSKAEAEGRLLVLPCKVGDTVYWIKGKAILEVYIQWFETNAYGWCACGTYPPMATPTFRFADFGKTVFLTKAAAEAALEKEETSDG